MERKQIDCKTYHWKKRKRVTKMSCVPERLSVAPDCELGFITPPSAPVFEPSSDEFRNPLVYINKIRPLGEAAGICKIKPPSDWYPPFEIDTEEFKFVPSIQQLTNLKCQIQAKLNFYVSLENCLGLKITAPILEGRAVDLHHLKLLTSQLGLNAWDEVSTALGFSLSDEVTSSLQNIYEMLILPFVAPQKPCNKSERYPGSEVTGSGETTDDGVWSDTTEIDTGPKSRKRYKTNITKKIKDDVDAKNSSKCQKNKNESEKLYQRGKHVFNPTKQYICPMCNRSDAEETFFFCTSCGDCYHSMCLAPPPDVSDDFWWCPDCLSSVLNNNLKEDFEETECCVSERSYTINQFGEMADHFKSEYFNMPVSMVPSALIEQEFWRLRNSPDDHVTVEYGNGIKTSTHGSGFPSSTTPNDPLPDVKTYVRSPWNLLRLPKIDGSALRYLPKTVPLIESKIDIGMCFANESWRTTDHWLYSVAYLHWGEERTWYAIPASSAEKFEEAFLLSHAEELKTRPGLKLLDLVTTTPNDIVSAGLKLFKLEQQPGEFVITFPRAYHANFNHGFNCSESVHFAPPDWLSFGSLCEKQYSSLLIPGFFSMNELICRMACSPTRLHPSLASATHQALLAALAEERTRVETVHEWGIISSERELMEVMTSEERRCAICRHVCFLSTVTCPCAPDKLVCLEHFKDLCDCPPEKHVLRFRYESDEFPKMLRSLKQCVKTYESWLTRATGALNDPENRSDLDGLRELLTDAATEQFPDSEILRKLRLVVHEAEELADLAAQLGNRKVRTRTAASMEPRIKLSFEELTDFCSALSVLPCRLRESNSVFALQRRVAECRDKAIQLLKESLADAADLEECIETAHSLDIHFQELPLLKQRLQQVEWLDEVRILREVHEQVTMYALRRVINVGISLPPHTAVEEVLTQLQMLLRAVEDWQERAKLCLDLKYRQRIDVLEALLAEAEKIPAFLPNIGALNNVLKKGKEWSAHVEAIQNSEEYPYLETVERLVSSGRGIPLDLPHLPVLESHIGAAKAWRDRTSRTFLRKNSLYTLMQALAPRTTVGVEGLSAVRRQMPYFPPISHEGCDSEDQAAVVSAFKGAEILEMKAMRDLRLENIQKRARDNGTAAYCICRRGTSGFMLQCELCKDWFHATCVPLPKSPGSKARLQTPAQQLAAAATKEVKFLCPCCLRSRRPRLETILALLVAMQKVPVRVPEGDALKCLTERAMNWQSRARQTLATEELASALAKLSVLSQKLVEAAAREKTEKIISNELKKAANKPELGLNVLKRVTFAQDEDNRGAVNNVKGTKGSPPSEINTSYGLSEHAYSSASKSLGGGPPAFGSSPLTSKSQRGRLVGGGACHQTGRQHASHREQGGYGQSPAVPLLSLSDAVRVQLEELMMEGDLLEVSLDETQHIWRILQATKPRFEDKYPDVEDLENELLACKAEREREKERLKEESRRRRKGDDFAAIKRMRAKYTREFDKYGRSKLKDKRRIFKREIKPPRMPRKRGGIARRTPGRRPKQESSDDDDDDDDEGDSCSAMPCLHPLEKEVNWVQCDGGCELWFHLYCIGLDKRDVKEDEDFVCRRCSIATQV